MPRFDTIIFDLDGTLTDSAPGIINSIKYASAKLGYRELTAPELRSCVGPPLAEHIMGILGLSQEESLEFLKAYRRGNSAGFIRELVGQIGFSGGAGFIDNLAHFTASH